MMVKRSTMRKNMVLYTFEDWDGVRPRTHRELAIFQNHVLRNMMKERLWRFISNRRIPLSIHDSDIMKAFDIMCDDFMDGGEGAVVRAPNLIDFGSSKRIRNYMARWESRLKRLGLFPEDVRHSSLSKDFIALYETTVRSLYTLIEGLNDHEYALKQSSAERDARLRDAAIAFHKHEWQKLRENMVGFHRFYTWLMEGSDHKYALDDKLAFQEGDKIPIELVYAQCVQQTFEDWKKEPPSDDIMLGIFKLSALDNEAKTLLWEHVVKYKADPSVSSVDIMMLYRFIKDLLLLGVYDQCYYPCKHVTQKLYTASVKYDRDVWKGRLKKLKLLPVDSFGRDEVKRQ